MDSKDIIDITINRLMIVSQAFSSVVLRDPDSSQINSQNYWQTRSKSLFFAARTLEFWHQILIKAFDR